MKRIAFALVLVAAMSARLAAQGPGPIGLTSRATTFTMTPPATRIAVAPSHGMTRSERGALIGGILGIVAGAAISYGYNERSFSSLASAGLVMAIPASLVGALIGMM